MNQLINQLMTEVFVEQPLASPGSANNMPQEGGCGDTLVDLVQATFSL